MALFPFSIADIDDPECIRVVLYASGRMGHAPLNALLKKAYEEMTKISKRMGALEKKLNMNDLTNVKQKQNAKKDDQSSISSLVSSGITISDIEMNAPEIKLESSVDKSSFVSQWTAQVTPKINDGSFISEPLSLKVPEISMNTGHNVAIEASGAISFGLKKGNKRE
ncbi:hypothetical protein [Bartonella massiliensis]|uniref:hypothetical protein n=1 Tax=Bartonella massiliensis TaxID=929795 RepID=UPI00115A1796|nr:hypothetical protein [Bartonella massiliensis]